MARKPLILKTIEEHFGTAEPVYSYFEKLTEAELNESLSGFSSQEPIDQVLYLFFQLFTNDDCLIAVPSKDYFWAYFYCMANDLMGFTRNYAAVGPTEDTFTIYGDVVFKLINNCKNIEFRSVAEFKALIALRMRWRALDIIKRNKGKSTTPLDPSQVDSKADFLNDIFSKEERLSAEVAISQLSKGEQVFFADCIDDISYDDLVKKYLPKETDIEKAKVALRQRKSRLMSRLRESVWALKLKLHIDRPKSRITITRNSKPVLLVVAIQEQSMSEIGVRWAKNNHPDKLIILAEVTSQKEMDDAIAAIRGLKLVVICQASPGRKFFAPSMPRDSYDTVFLVDGNQWHPPGGG